jgi:ATP phosphoribosyltransferase
MTTANDPLRIAVPKGRIMEELLPLLSRAGVELEGAFADKNERKLEFATNIPNLSILRVRSFDIATFVAFGAAQMGIAGRDVLMEFDYPEVYAPLDLKIGYCRMVVAEKTVLREKDNPSRWSHVRVATKYPEITRRHFC